jgi:hypothetical protein
MTTEALRYFQGPDGEHYVNVRDLTSLFIATHDQLTEEGEDSIYGGIATALATPFMEIEQYVPSGLHTEPGGAGEDR